MWLKFSAPNNMIGATDRLSELTESWGPPRWVPAFYQEPGVRRGNWSVEPFVALLLPVTVSGSPLEARDIPDAAITKSKGAARSVDSSIPFVPVPVDFPSIHQSRTRSPLRCATPRHMGSSPSSLCAITTRPRLTAVSARPVFWLLSFDRSQGVTARLARAPWYLPCVVKRGDQQFVDVADSIIRRERRMQSSQVVISSPPISVRAM
ncbi:hypothetical protein QBC36DRAFT_307627 [Triangularia setosa]|uniref:Uncharacterized protein n=1 Tax=Triangularia setosa TaxID=2587417 RepID=A0AAN6WEK4_9PEZI|nr:hypothetical protein QBC36DRAFT_307627 [Podospora setosa]